MDTNMNEIKILVREGYTVNIKPVKLMNEWLDMAEIGFEVTVLFDGVQVSSGRSLDFTDAVSDAYVGTPEREYNQ